MPQLIKSSDAMELLRKNPGHPLWNKRVSLWTGSDIDNIRFGNVPSKMNGDKISTGELAAARGKISFKDWTREIENRIQNPRFTENELELHQEELLK